MKNLITRMEERHKSQMSFIEKLIACFMALWVLWVIVCIALAGVGIWVAFHFISKYW